jgi:glycosyltransferase involved in cell wall biosynthesis
VFALRVVFLLPWKDHLVPALEELGVKCTCLDVRDERDVRWASRFRRLLIRDPVDIVHAHSPYAAAIGRLVVRSLPRAKRPRLVSTEHNPWSTFKLPTRLANRLTAPLDDAILAVSAEARASMSGRQRDRAQVLVHGIDVAGTAGQRSSREATRHELAIPDDVVAIGTVANYHPKKDWPNLLAAVRELVDRGLPIQVVAVGQGPLEAEVEARRRELRLEHHVTLTGYRPDAVRLMAGCDVFVLASRYEGLPVVLMEASALGLPIVTTAVGGIPDVFTDGVDALIVPPGSPRLLADALESLVLDPGERERLGTAAALRAPEFSISRAVTEIESTYRRVLA